jgi:hypothetical protein
MGGALALFGFGSLKAVWLIMWVIARANSIEFSFGTVRSTVLKLYGAVVTIDAGRAWLPVAMRTAGMIPPSGKMPAGAFWVDLLATFVAAICLARFVDRLNDDDGKAFVGLVGFWNLALGFALRLLFVAVGHALLATVHTVL